ncbi:NB-ARC domain-containing protein [Streptomyces europaeiscabiei]|uniref:AfsR/SARP family transcriptional regulator n=1 Tax=Streptomyces europaeiscabiei TaxID=146819 RepID=UPI002E1988D5
MPAHMFRTLGSMEFLVDGDRVELGGVKRKLLLGAFLLHANQPLTTRKLFAALWESPPTSGMANLYTYLSALRRVLTVDGGAGAAPRSLLVREAGGHRLQVRTGEVDLLMFSKHARRGHELLAEGRLEEAAEQLGAADALWQGSPLEGLATARWMHAVIRRWEEARTTQLKDWIEARLMLGQHHMLTAELRAHLEIHPLSEALWGQLMLALYRSDRQGEALGAFTEARSRLASELGVEPSPPLRELHHAILTQSSTLDLEPPRSRLELHGPRTSRHEFRVPNQLPPDPVHFTGRKGEADRLSAALAEASEGADGQPAGLAVITGPPGSGKTSLALHVAHRVREHFPDGQLFLKLPGPGSGTGDVTRVLKDLLVMLGADRALIPVCVEQLSAHYRMRLADLRVLVVVDDVAGSEQVRHLLPGTAGSLVLATSRLRLTALDSTCTASLGPLSEEESLSLLSRLVGPGRLDADPRAARFIVGACEHLPLAIRIAGARIALRPDQPLSAFAERLLHSGSSLGEFVHDGLDLRASFNASFRALDPLAADAFSQLGRMGGEVVDVAAVAALTGRDQVEADHALEHLIAGNLLQPVRGVAGSRPAYRLSGLLGAYARELDVPPPAPRAARTAPPRRVATRIAH